jgi:hypothetical protein
MCSNEHKLDGMWPKNMGPLAAARGDGWATLIAGGSEEVVGEVGMRGLACHFEAEDTVIKEDE